MTIEESVDGRLFIKGDTQERTGLSKAQFRSSFQSIPDAKGAIIVTLIREARQSSKAANPSAGERPKKVHSVNR